MPDIEVGLMAFFDDAVDAYADALSGIDLYTVTSTPQDLLDRVAGGQRVLRIRRIGGGSDGGNDHPVVSLQSFASSQGDPGRAAGDVYVRPVMALSQAVEDRFLGLNDSGPVLRAGTVIEDPEKNSGPVELLYPNPAISVVESIYRCTTRR